MVGDGFAIEALGDELERRALSALPDLLTEIRAAAEQVKTAAEAEWPVGRHAFPVDKGRPHSRDLFEIRTTKTGPGSYVVAIANRADYVRYIVPYKLARESGRSKVAFVKYLWDPLKAKRDGLVLVLAEAVVNGLRRG